MPGPVVAGILAVASAEDVLRHGFEAAHDRDVPLHVLVAGPAAVAGRVDDVHEVIGRWSQKYPVLPATVSVRAGLDAVIVLTAATSGGGLLVAAETHGSREDAIIRALAANRLALWTQNMRFLAGDAAGEALVREEPDRVFTQLGSG
jgi:hypothetical protein